MCARTRGGGAWDWADAIDHPSPTPRRAIVSELFMLALTDWVVILVATNGYFIGAIVVLIATSSASILFEAAAAWVVALVGWPLMGLTTGMASERLGVTCGDWPNEERGDSKKVGSLHSVMVKVQLASSHLSGDQSSAERGEGHEYSTLHGGGPTS